LWGFRIKLACFETAIGGKKIRKKIRKMTPQIKELLGTDLRNPTNRSASPILFIFKI
jgi:hypothetical protein